MTWSTTPPTQAGRYWWRAPSEYESVEARARKAGAEYAQYGLILVIWVNYSREYPPALSVRSVCSFNGSYGGEITPGEGWSYGGAGAPDEFHRHYPGVQFWSEPERGPQDFLPELPGLPAWAPPEPKSVEPRKPRKSRK